MCQSTLSSHVVLLRALLWSGLLLGMPAQTPAEVVITEFVASNDHGIQDEDGASSDWIEIQNQGPAAINLNGWYLTDDSASLTKWRLPSTNLLVNDFLIVFASGKNRTAPGAPLHANFNLSAKGGYLALVKPDGVQRASEFNPYPPQVQDIAYGVRQDATQTSYLLSGAPLRYWVPSDGSLALTWTGANPFDDSGWDVGQNGVGFQALTSGFAVRMVTARIQVTNGTAAEAVLTNKSLQASQAAENRPVINYRGTGTAGRFLGDNPFPGTAATNVNVDDFVVEATGVITIPSAGFWTFGVHSDAGFRLSIGNFNVASNRTIASETLAALNFAAAGDYPVRLVMYDRTGGAEVEFYVASGNQPSFNTNLFALVGDTAKGGLTVRGVPAVENQIVSYASAFQTDLHARLRGINSSAYLRLPFVAPQPGTHSGLSLRVQYDDGFAAFLNGTETSRRLAPSPLAWNSKAVAARPPTQGLVRESINLTPYLGALRTGNNVLAVQLLTDSSNAPEALWFGELVGYSYVNSTNQYFARPTPGELNDAPGYAFVSDTKFSHDRGFYETNFNLVISCDTPGAAIRYTTNGSPPSLTNGVVYGAPIPIRGTTTIRAAAFAPGFTPSDIDTHTYIFVNDVVQQSPNHQTPPGWPATWGANTVDYGMDPRIVNHPVYGQTIRDDLKSLPSFSIVMRLEDLFNASRGIYANPSEDGALWERPMSLELIYPDGRKGFQVNGGIRLRGGFSRSTDNPKHAFRFFFREEYGAAKLNYPVFGPDAAPNFDKFDLRTFQNYSWAFQGDTRGCFIRDVFSRDTQLALGQPSAHGDYYHLYINGVYWGLYNTEERPEASFGESYFGGKEADYDVVKVEAGPYTINATDGNMTAWTNLWKQVELGVANDAAYQRIQGNNPDGTRNPEFPVLLDVDNLIDYMLVILYGGNLDAPISAFLSNNSPNNWYGLRDRNGEGGYKFVVHDSEHTLLNLFEDRTGIHLNGANYVIDFSAGATADTSSPQRLWLKLHSNPEFRLRVADRVQRYCFNGGVLTPEAARERFLRRMNELDRAVICESARWGDAKRPTSPLTRTDWLSACNTVLNDFIANRTAVLLDQLRADGLYPAIDPPEFSQFGGLLPVGGQIRLSSPKGEGTIYYTLDGSDPRGRGGAVGASAVAYSAPLILTTATQVRARVLSGNSWSAVVEPVFYPDQPFTDLQVTEIMYNPPSVGSTAGDEFEFVELKNVGTSSLELTGISFSSGIGFSFADGTVVGPGQFLVLGRNEAQLIAKYPGLKVHGIFSGKLDNSGETLTLQHPIAGPIWSMTYGDRSPWPVTADGLGFSLVPRDPSVGGDLSDGTRWRASGSLGGSPGRDDTQQPIPGVLVNEVLASTVGNQPDQVELFNPTAASVNVGGWWLTDDPSEPKKFRLPPGTLIAPGGYVVFNEPQFNPNPGSPTSFSFSNEGESVYLFSANAAGELTGYSDGFSFGASSPGYSFGRYQTSTKEIHFPALASRTFGGPNAGPLVGPVVISEVQYHPSPEYDEFIELQNLSAAPVPLFDVAHPTNTWRISGVGFSFPTNVTLAPGGLALITILEPNVFREKYRVPATVPIFGPYAGALQDEGERIGVGMPIEPSTNGVFYVTVDSVRYRSAAPWPTEANGRGPSLQRRALDQYGDDPVNWFTSGMTPGRLNRTNVPPQISIISPGGGGSYTAPVTLTLEVNVADTDGQPMRVEYLLDGETIGESTASPFSFVWQNVPTGRLNITARVTDDGYASGLSAPLSLTVNPAPPGNGIGLKAEYFTGTRPGANRARITRIDPFVDNHWGSGSPAPGMPADQFSVRWSGFVQARYSGEHSFYTVTDDGVRLWVNNQPLIDNWTDHGDTEDVGSIQLVAGQRYSIVLEMYENGGGATASLGWSAPNLAKEIIPPAQLYPVPGELDTPILLTLPQPVSVALGSSATFFVAAVGTGSVQYQWRFNGVPITGATSNLLTIPSTQASSEGNYDVVVKDDVRTKITPAVALRALLKPSIVQHPLSVGVVEGETVVFTVEATGSEPLVYRWRKGTVPVTNYTDFLSSPIYVLPNVQAGHSGFYSVTVSNQAAVATSSSGGITILADADGDHIADIWEAAHGLSSSNPADAALDLDGDGMTNLQEYLADTDPNDRASRLSLYASPGLAGGIDLTFELRSNKTYTVQASQAAALTDWTNLVHLFPRSTNRVGLVTDPHPSNRFRIYRLITPLQP